MASADGLPRLFTQRFPVRPGHTDLGLELHVRQPLPDRHRRAHLPRITACIIKLAVAGFKAVIASRDQAMDVRMVVQLPRPGMQHLQHADRAATVTRVAGQFHQRLCAGLHQECVTVLLVGAEARTQVPRDRDDDVEVQRWQHLGMTLPQLLVGLTVWHFGQARFLHECQANSSLPQASHRNWWPPSPRNSRCGEGTGPRASIRRGPDPFLSRPCLVNAVRRARQRTTVQGGGSMSRGRPPLGPELAERVEGSAPAKERLKIILATSS